MCCSERVSSSSSLSTKETTLPGMRKISPGVMVGSFSSSSHSSAFSMTTISLLFSRISRSFPNSWSALRYVSKWQTCQAKGTHSFH